ncbi:hypothetical protein INT50_14340 [Vibrio diabolicus]|uniref:hypothetical protein n=1 Tax=Vibrio diabolicus subgroup TaxID=2315253 RepID=UPI0013DF3B9E|nr:MULTISPECIES: hypothetical protein [Vibrio diabolicus subgroup]MCR9848602.1 hypothetical protein [Vibrio antiquarius]MCR9913299.1 hypothetical protein [Vibrio antiquarius]QOV31534.1 hypothetical protein INT50_14340 [Vibrio diabolicus]
MFRLRHGHFLRQRENIDIEIDDNEYQLHYQAYKLVNGQNKQGQDDEQAFGGSRKREKKIKDKTAQMNWAA